MSDTLTCTKNDLPRRIGWVIFALPMATFVLGTMEFVAMSLLPQIATAFRVSERQTGNAISAYALGVVVASPVVVMLAAELPRRSLLIGLTFIMAAGNALSTYAPPLPLFLAFRFLSKRPLSTVFPWAADDCNLIPTKSSGNQIDGSCCQGPQSRLKELPSCVSGNGRGASQ